MKAIVQRACGPAELLETGKITPAIDRVVPLSEVPAAMQYLESGKVLGKIVIKI
jgi:NADPH:quinone reductase-like Zn-dependent oxidoreductase